MSNHASWMEEAGVCAACKKTDPSQPCDRRAVEKKTLVTLIDALRNHLLGRKKPDLHADKTDVLPGT